MARTRLRGLEIGDVQIGIEVPEDFEWHWPEEPVAEFQCLPRDPEVHVGVRVGSVAQQDLAGERYSVGAWTFEVARRGSDWQLGLSRAGRRSQLALFDREFRIGEVVVSREAASEAAYPLRGPLDEWIVLHRIVANGGLCLNARATGQGAVDGQAIVHLGEPARSGVQRWSTPSFSLLGRTALLIRERSGELRLFRTPWSDTLDQSLGYRVRVREFHCACESERPYSELQGPEEAADLLVRHAVVPLCGDDALFERVLRNARRLARTARIFEVGERRPSDAPMAWRSAQVQGAFAPPRSAF